MIFFDNNIENIKEYINTLSIKPLGIKDIIWCPIAMSILVCGGIGQFSNEPFFDSLLCRICIIFYVSCIVISVIGCALYPLRKKVIYFFSGGLECISFGAFIGSFTVLVFNLEHSKLSWIYFVCYIISVFIMIIITLCHMQKKLAMESIIKKSHV